MTKLIEAISAINLWVFHSSLITIEGGDKMHPSSMELITDYKFSSRKFIRVGLCGDLPTIILVDKMSVLYVDKWRMELHCTTSPVNLQLLWEKEERCECGADQF